jgi:hypothetical protein
MDRRAALGAGAVVIGAGSLGYALFASASDEELITELLDELARTLSFSAPIGNVVFHGARLSESFQELLTERVVIRASEMSAPLPTERGKLGLAAAHVFSRYGSLDVSFSIDALQVEGNSARCNATATAMALEHGVLRRTTRPIQLTLRKEGSDWRIEAAQVQALQEDD